MATFYGANYSREMGMGKKLDYMSRCNFSGDSTLHFAAKINFYEYGQLLLKHGADIEVKNLYGHTPLRDAVFGNRLEMTKLLLEHGASVHGTLDLLAVVSALHNKDTRVIDLLFEYGFNVNEYFFDRKPFLHTAAVDHRCCKSVRLLLNFGADIDLCDNEHMTALELSVINRHDDVVHVLVEHVIQKVCLGVGVCKENCELTHEFLRRMQPYVEECDAEVEAMREHFISLDHRYTLYDIMTQPELVIDEFVTNNIIQTQLTVDYSKKYPIFNPHIVLRVKMLLRRVRLKCKGRAVLDRIVGHRLPLECLNRIIYNFHDGELLRLVKNFYNNKL